MPVQPLKIPVSADEKDENEYKHKKSLIIKTLEELSH